MGISKLLMVVRSTLLLRAALIAMGTFVIFLCALMSVVFTTDKNPDDPILIPFRFVVLGLYLASIPFHYALYQAWKLLGLIDKKMAFTSQSVAALKKIKRSAIIIAVLFITYMPLILNVAQIEDAPGVAAIGVIIIFMSSVIAVFTGLLQKLFQNAVDIKSENDLTV